MTRARDLADSADLAFDGDTLKIDTTNNRVGIGTSSPASELAIEATGAGARFEVETTGSTGFRIYQDDSDGFTRLHTYDTTGTTYGKGMSFWTAPSGGATAERMRIADSGDVAIGTTSPRNELTVDGIISGITVNTSSGNSNITVKSGMSGAYLAFVTWNNGSGYATLHISTALSNSGQIIASSNSSGGNNAFDVTNSFSSNSGNGIALFINGTNLNLQTKDNWSANAHPIRISLFGG